MSERETLEAAVIEAARALLSDMGCAAARIKAPGTQTYIVIGTYENIVALMRSV